MATETEGPNDIRSKLTSKGEANPAHRFWRKALMIHEMDEADRAAVAASQPTVESEAFNQEVDG